MEPVDTVRDFLQRINEHDVDKLTELMTEDHLFVDSQGQSVKGREAMRAAWQSYYAFCPDFWIWYEAIFQKDNQVAVFGTTGGTISVKGALLPANRWRTPAAWLATVSDQRIQEWRVYADTKPVHDILAMGQE